MASSQQPNPSSASFDDVEDSPAFGAAFASQFGPFEEISGDERERLSSEFSANFPHLAAAIERLRPVEAALAS